MHRRWFGMPVLLICLLALAPMRAAGASPALAASTLTVQWSGSGNAIATLSLANVRGAADGTISADLVIANNKAVYYNMAFTASGGVAEQIGGANLFDTLGRSARELGTPDSLFPIAGNSTATLAHVIFPPRAGLAVRLAKFGDGPKLEVAVATLDLVMLLSKLKGIPDPGQLLSGHDDVAFASSLVATLQRAGFNLASFAQQVQGGDITGALRTLAEAVGRAGPALAGLLHVSEQALASLANDPGAVLQSLNFNLLPVLYDLTTAPLTGGFTITNPNGGAPAPSRVPAQPADWSDRYVVLLAGICAEGLSVSVCATPGTRLDPAARTTDFGGIVRQLRAVGVPIPADHVYSYSYFIRNNLPNKTWYYMADTHEPLEVAAYQLDTQLRGIVRAHPDATFDLIGHSLGGVVAAYWVVKHATPGMLTRIHSLITLDSPVSGTKSPSAILGSVVSGPVWLDLQPWSAPIRAIDDSNSGVVARLTLPADRYTMTTDAGDGSTFTNNTRVYTISNTADQLIGPIDSQLPGARANKVIFSCPGAEAVLECHIRVLHDPQAVKWAADFAATTIRHK